MKRVMKAEMTRVSKIVKKAIALEEALVNS